MKITERNKSKKANKNLINNKKGKEEHNRINNININNIKEEKKIMMYNRRIKGSLNLVYIFKPDESKNNYTVIHNNIIK